jgi:hypothetical protein
MTRSRTLAALLGLTLSAVLVLTACGRSPGKKGDGGAGGESAAEAGHKETAKGFVVFRMEEELRVLPTADYDALRKKLNDEYSQAMARYEEEQQAAEKNNGAFDKPMPLPRKAPRYKETFATEEEAIAYRDKILAKQKAAAEKKAAKKKSPAKRKPPAKPPADPPEEGGDEGGRP